MDELEKRVQQFKSLSLPGQPMSMHMGTLVLVNDLWREIQRLRQQNECDECCAPLPTHFAGCSKFPE